MTTQEIYDKYRIPPWLQEHQLRVAAVGRSIALACAEPVDAEVVTVAGLFHDMGNILKVDLSSTGPLVALIGAQNLAHWQKVKDDFLARYGPDEHKATVAIAKEMGLQSLVVDIIGSIGFDGLSRLIASSDPMEKKITEYGDFRVGPYGVLPVRERVEEAYARYRARMEKRGDDPGPYYAALADNAELLEKQVFAKCRIRPEDMTDTSIAPLIEELRTYQVD